MDGDGEWPLDASGGKIRGFICRAFTESIQAQLGDELVAEKVRAVARSSGSWQVDPGATGLNFLHSRWYPAPLVNALIDAAVDGLPRPRQLEIAGRAGRATFRRQITGLQRALFALFLTPERLAKHGVKAWRHNYGSGDVSFEAFEGSTISTYRNWTEHHPLTCRAMMMGRIELYRAMKLPDVRVKVLTCDPRRGCRSRVWWGPRGDDEPAMFDGHADDPV
ncbi:MAG: hypothetical protein AAGA54_32380 [Myxococcota bacterium]